MISDKISTRRLEICNSDGQPAMTLECCGDGKPYIRLYDSRGCERLVVSLDDDDQPQFGLLDLDGHTLVGIGVKEDLGSGINIFDSEGNLKLVVGLDTHGNVKLGEV